VLRKIAQFGRESDFSAVTGPVRRSESRASANDPWIACPLEGRSQITHSTVVRGSTAGTSGNNN
jgi:hypothetical protein